MKIDILDKTLKIIGKWDKGTICDNHISLNYVADSYENGTPKQPSILYFYFEVNRDIPESDEDKLNELGWKCDWPYYTLNDN